MNAPHFLPTATPPHELLSLLESVALDPAGARPVAADWLDEYVPPARPLDRHACRVPGWFARSWRRNVRPRQRGYRLVDMEVSYLAGRLLDHWGVVYVHGIAALLSEPYFDLRPDSPHYAEKLTEVCDVLDAVAELSGGVGLYAATSAHNPPWTCRLLWLPHPGRLAEAMRGQGNMTRAR